MCPHVGGDGAGLGELSVTNGTSEWFLSAVSAAVGGQVGCLAERLVTLTTPVGSLSAVGS